MIALSLPVDYWDRLGWKDTFGNPQHTHRQRDYARARGDGEIYTPQVVINGRVHAVGSSAQAIEDGLAATRPVLEKAHVPVRLHHEGHSVLVEVGSAPSSTSAVSGTLWLAAVQSSGTVAIGRGENSGRRITYRNIVRSLRPVGTWSGSPLAIRVAEADIFVAGTQSVVALLQEGVVGPIIGAARAASAE